MKGVEDILYVGFDESNHGRFPEVFVSVFSRISEDIERKNGKEKWSKLRARRNNSPSKVLGRGRKYSFLLAQRTDQNRFPKNEYLGIILSSLIEGRDLSLFEKVKIYVDGALQTNSKIYARDIISEIHNYQKSRIIVESGPEFDKFYKVVNIADSIAHYIFRSPLEKISKNPPLKQFLK